MTDLTKEESYERLISARPEWQGNREKCLFDEGWNAALAYKDKRITELEKALKIIEIKWNDSTARITELEKYINELKDQLGWARKIDISEGGGA